MVATQNQQIDIVMPIGPGDQEWAGEAIESILNQVNVDVRLILVLDQRRILPESAVIFSQEERVLVQENMFRPGISGALHTGFELAETMFVARMDADDISHPYRLITQLEAALPHHAVIGTDTVNFQSDEHLTWPNETLSDATVLKVDTRSLLRQNRIAHPSTIIRLDAYHEVGGYNRRSKKVEDYDLWLRLASVGDIGMIEKHLLGYRTHSAQYSHHGNVLSDFKLLHQSRLALVRSLGMPMWNAYFGTYSFLFKQASLSKRIRLRPHTDK